MRGHIIRKLLVVLIIVAPVVSYTGCKKQAKCGCEGDILFSLTSTPSTLYWESGSSIFFYTTNDQFSTYNFCNPGEMFPKLDDSKSGDILLVTGDVFWDCNYLYQSSNYSYQTYSKVYVIKVTDVVSNLYGKK